MAGQRENIIPRHLRVAVYKTRIYIHCHTAKFGQTLLKVFFRTAII